MTSKSYTNRTTLWDEPVSAEPSAPQPIPSRGAWRAPSAVLAGDRPARRVVSAMPPVLEDEEHAAVAPARTRFVVAGRHWWRPRSTFGKVMLGSGTVLVLGGLTAAGILTQRFLVRDRHFRIEGVSSIQSTGLSEVNRADVLPVFGEDIGRNIFFVPLAARRQQLETIPWVQQATVMRFLPDRLSVSIVERTPVAFVRQGQQVELADADGVILSMPPSMMAQHHYSFPVVTGINAEDSPAARKARMAVYQRFVAELDQNNQHLTEQVSEIDLADPEDLRATMPEQSSDILAHFGEDHFLDRLQLYKSHIAEWRGRYPKLIGVDLRYNGEVPLEMATGMATDASSNSPASTPVAPPAIAAVKIAAAADTAKPALPKPTKTSAARLAPTTPTPSRAEPATGTAPLTTAHKAATPTKAEKLKLAKAKAAHNAARSAANRKAAQHAAAQHATAQHAAAHPPSHPVSHPAPQSRQGQ